MNPPDSASSRSWIGSRSARRALCVMRFHAEGAPRKIALGALVAAGVLQPVIGVGGFVSSVGQGSRLWMIALQSALHGSPAARLPFRGGGGFPSRPLSRTIKAAARIATISSTMASSASVKPRACLELMAVVTVCM